MRIDPNAFVGPADDTLPVVMDDAAAQIRKVVTIEPELRLIGRHVKELNEALLKNVGALEPRNSSGVEAAQYIDACIDVAETILKARHSAYSPLRWLWYLRRIPDELFASELPSTLGYDTTLAESLTWLVVSSDERLESEMPLRFPIDPSVCRHIVRLVAGVKYLSHLHVLARYAGKGASFSARGPATPLSVVSDSVPKDALAIYDRRLLDEDVHVYAGLGLSPTASEPQRSANSSFEVCLLDRCEPHRIRCMVAAQGGYVDANISCRFRFRAIPVQQLLLPFGHPLVQESYPSVKAMGLIMLSMTYPLFFERLPWCVGSALQHGYFVVHDSAALDVFAEALIPVRTELQLLGYDANLPESARAWLQTLETTAPTLWPFVRAGFVRRQKRVLAFDIAAASQAVLDFFRAKRLSGEAGNQRGQQFELNLQGSISATPWDPPPEITALRGRTLRVAGAAITDADALAANAETLLLISCKSLIYDAAYDAGRFAAVRNAREVVSNAVAAWGERLNQIRRRKVGDNFDVSAYDEILGVVCTPFAPYTDDAAALAFVRPGLRAACSASELVEWLQSDSRQYRSNSLP